MSVFILSHPLFLTFSFFFFNDTATTEIYTLSLHDALPISGAVADRRLLRADGGRYRRRSPRDLRDRAADRSEEHTSELQSLAYLVCRLLLEKKKKKQTEGWVIRPENIIRRTHRRRATHAAH